MSKLKKADLRGAGAKRRNVRDLILELKIFAAISSNGRSSCCIATQKFTPLQKNPRCERSQHENAMAEMGSQPPCGSAENISISSECGWRLSTLWVDRFALAANAHFPPLHVEIYAVQHSLFEVKKGRSSESLTELVAGLGC